jgi:C4-dicarboxylate-specific signal transduction histidine kinase
MVISWGGSDQSFWVSVLDFGDGPPADLPEVFTVGTSSKEDHLGMGLAIAQQAMATVGGSALLNAQADGTTKFEVSAPKLVNTE